MTLQIFLPFTDPNHNFALGKPTQQSTTFKNYVSSLAVDGNMHTSLWENGPKCAHTSKGTGNWWRIDFLEKILVARVAFLNRRDCCYERMRDFELRVR